MKQLAVHRPERWHCSPLCSRSIPSVYGRSMIGAVAAGADRQSLDAGKDRITQARTFLARWRRTKASPQTLRRCRLSRTVLRRRGEHSSPAVAAAGPCQSDDIRRASGIGWHLPSLDLVAGGRNCDIRGGIDWQELHRVSLLGGGCARQLVAGVGRWMGALPLIIASSRAMQRIRKGQLH